MEKSLWQTRFMLILAGILLGLAARAVLGDPEPEMPPGPSFANPLPADVPLSFPLIETEPT